MVNGPGNFHDSTLSDYGMYDKMELVYNSFGAKIVVDSAFKIGNAPYLIKSSQLDPVDPELIVLNREATSVCQLSEWGMKMIQASFPRLKDPLLYKEKGERFIILRLMLNLFNHQAHVMGQNQIFNSFMADNSFYRYDNIYEDFNDYL